MTLEELSCSVAPTHATIEGEVSGGARVGSLELRREWSFRAQVSGLDEASPHLHFERVEGE
ncbi:MAG: hypothetical protein AB8H86_02745 [Polyangiales bacterium]